MREVVVRFLIVSLISLNDDVLVDKHRKIDKDKIERNEKI